MNRIFSASICAAAMCMSFGSQAIATPGVTSVRSGDLDLSKPTDVARLRHRFLMAVRSVCDSADGVFPEASRADAACERDTQKKYDAAIVALLDKSGPTFASR